MNKREKAREKLKMYEISIFPEVFMRYKTDLAIECMEDIEAAERSDMSDDMLHNGINVEKRIYDDDISITKIQIVDERGEKIFSKRKGNYITLEVNGIIEGHDGIKERASRALSQELLTLIGFRHGMSVLLVGLGNSEVTPDALGPYTAAKVKTTRHMFDIYEIEQDCEISAVSSITPGVTGITGIETADMIKKVTELVKPDAVIIVDSLAARNIARVNTTVQMNDTGISPGSGMGNVRKDLNKETLGCTVIAIGVPTVIDAATLVIDALSGANISDDDITEYLEKNPQQLVVTSTDIDTVIKDFSDIIANGINITLHPGIYS